MQKHEDLPLKVCEVCGKAFKIQQRYTEHVKSHNQKGPKPKIFQCNQCEYITNYEQSLDVHMQTISPTCHPFQEPTAGISEGAKSPCIYNVF